MKSLKTALDVLCEFNGGTGDLGVKEICERTGLQKSQVSKLLQVFRDQRLLNQDPVSRRYSVAQRLFSIGSGFVNGHPLAAVSLPIVRDLVEQTGHSITISVLDEEVVHLLAVEGPQFLDARWRVGPVVRFHVSASARVLLAFQPRTVTEQLIARHGLPELTERTVTTPEALFAHLDRIPRQGYDVSRSEGAIGLGAIAAPVFGEDQKVIAAIGMIFPERLISDDQQGAFIAQLHAAARRLSGRMGAPIYPYGTDAS